MRQAVNRFARTAGQFTRPAWIRPGRTPNAGAFLSILLLAFLPAAFAQSSSREYQLKAAFLFNFAQFTQWPTNAFTNSHSPIVIGVLGRDPFGQALQETVKGEFINGRPLALQHYDRVEEIKECHILFIAPSENRRSHRVVEALANRPILTVADAETEEGREVMIRFVERSNKLRVRINLEAVSEADLTLSSKLLRAAELVSAGRSP